MKKKDFKEKDFLCGSIWTHDKEGKEVATCFSIFNALKSLYPDYDIYTILHDKDEGKPFHVHFVVVVKDACNIFITKLASKLNISTDLISVREGENYKGAIRYLIHRDDENKYPYNTLDDKTIPNDYNSYENFYTTNFQEFYEICKYLHYSIDNLKYAETQREFLQLFGSEILSNKEVKTAVSFWYSSPALQNEIQMLKEAKAEIENEYHRAIKHFDEISQISTTNEKEALRLLRAWFNR